MMINFTLILLFNFIFIFSSGKCVSSSCIYKAVGERVEIPLEIGELQDKGDLIWIHNQSRLYKKSLNVKNPPFDVDHSGSLILENIQKERSGKYEAEVYDEDGKLRKKTTHQLCVQEPVPEPTVVVECVEEGVDLRCSALNSNEASVNSSEASVSWMKNGELSDSTRVVLHVGSSELNATHTFSCTLRNMISTAAARDVQPDCSDTDPPLVESDESETKKLLFGLDFWWMLVVLTGGASFLLVLVIICLVCVCRCSARNKRKAREEAELRLVPLMPDYTDQPDVQYMQKTDSDRPSKSLRPLPPLPCPRGPALQPQ
ncbi:hypothetical protein R3I94_007080 [Phoxinus phoxinus]